METAVAALLSTDAKGLNADGEKPLPKSQVERVRTNAIHCLVVLLRASQGTSLRRIQRALQKHLWAPKARRHRTENEKLEVLLAARDPTAASVTFALLDDEAVLQGQKAGAAAQGEQRAQTRAQGLEQQIADLEHRLRETTGQCAELREETRRGGAGACRHGCAMERQLRDAEGKDTQPADRGIVATRRRDCMR